jgi:hypothetical protein
VEFVGTYIYDSDRVGGDKPAVYVMDVAFIFCEYPQGFGRECVGGWLHAFSGVSFGDYSGDVAWSDYDGII